MASLSRTHFHIYLVLESLDKYHKTYALIGQSVVCWCPFDNPAFTSSLSMNHRQAIDFILFDRFVWTEDLRSAAVIQHRSWSDRELTEEKKRESLEKQTDHWPISSIMGDEHEKRIKACKKCSLMLNSLLLVWWDGIFSLTSSIFHDADDGRGNDDFQNRH